MNCSPLLNSVQLHSACFLFVLIQKSFTTPTFSTNIISISRSFFVTTFLKHDMILKLLLHSVPSASCYFPQHPSALFCMFLLLLNCSEFLWISLSLSNKLSAISLNLLQFLKQPETLEAQKQQKTLGTQWTKSWTFFRMSTAELTPSVHKATGKNV